MKIIPEISSEAENFRMMPENGFMVIRRDPVEPVPVGSLIAKVFRVTGYTPDCDGSLMAQLAEVDADGEETGWEVGQLGITGNVQLEAPNELHRAAHAPPGEDRGPTR